MLHCREDILETESARRTIGRRCWTPGVAQAPSANGHREAVGDATVARNDASRHTLLRALRYACGDRTGAVRTRGTGTTSDLNDPGILRRPADHSSHNRIACSGSEAVGDLHAERNARALVGHHFRGGGDEI